MAEGSSVSDPEGLEKRLQSLLSRHSGDESGADSELFCVDFCKALEECASHWRVPLPRLRVLQIALGQFSRASAFLPTSCDRVNHTISSLALSVFESLLFFDQEAFNEEPVKQFTTTFQECHSVLAKYENVFLLQVERLLQDGGPWASPTLQAILSESNLPQSEVDSYVGTEPPAFLDLRVRYLSACGRGSEAASLAKRCARHPAAGQPLFFLQVYLSWLLKTAQLDRLHQEVADVSGNDALHVVCSMEGEESDDTLLTLSTAFLSQQLQRGDMFCLCELVLVWANLHRRLNTSKQALLEACHQLMLSATKVKSIFPFIRAILQEVGDEGVQFCVELCANALRSCLPCDALTKTLIYKTIAGLLPSDLDVCRTCALLVFFLERSVESYKMVYLLYMHPDQEYHVDDSPIGNNIRFETMQILKKDLYFDPEFWNLIALRTNCLKLMSEKVINASLEEIMEDKWISKYCTRGSAPRSVCQRGAAAKKRHHKEDKFCKRDSKIASKRYKVDAEKMRLNSHALRRRGNQGSQALRESSSGALRRSFWQLDRIHSLTLRYDEHRRTTRFSEKNLPKRKIKKPKWLLEDSGALENVPLKIKRNGLKQQKLLRPCVIKRPQPGPMKNNSKLKPPVNTHLKAKENNKYQNGLSQESGKPANPPQIILELSLPDNELMDTFNEDSCCRPKRFSQVLLYKPTVKYPDTSPPSKTGHGKEVILRARDTTTLVQLVHCYTRRQKGKGSASNLHGSVSTITRSSSQVSPSKDSELCERPVLGAKSATSEKAKEKLPKAQSTKEDLDFFRITQSEPEEVLESVICERDPSEVPEETLVLTNDLPQAVEPFEESAVEMKVTIASQASVLEKVSKSPAKDDVAQVSQISKIGKSKKESEEINTVLINSNDFDDALQSQSEDVTVKHVEQETKTLSSQENDINNSTPSSDVLPNIPAEVLRKSPKGNVVDRNDKSPVKPAASSVSPVKACASDKPIRVLAAEMVTENAPEPFPDQDQNLSNSPRGKGNPTGAEKIQTTSISTVQDQEASVVDVQVKKENVKAVDARSETSENSELLEMGPETEESKLEHYCTFCSKLFMGPRVVEHAMFHFRKDECTFCRTVFKDDLLAMMHLSDHIEKMKRLKAEENGVSSPKPSAKAKATNFPTGHKEKPKKSLPSSADRNQSEPRALRSNQKQTSATTPSEKQTSKCVKGDAAVHRLNGHIGKKDQSKRFRKDSDFKQESVDKQLSEQRTRFRAVDSRLQENRQLKSDCSVSGQTSKKLNSSKDGKKKRDLLQLQQTDSKQTGVEQQEKVSCPAKRCSWSTDVAKNRVGLLYHSLDKHYGDIKTLELAFRVGDGKCSICMRVMWSFEHFLHHVERHRLAPRHPCPHQGCKARFKSGMEMRRHARKHAPLQAVCCRPGCSKLFICLWALNLHEREHYGSKSAETDPNENAQRPSRTPDGKTTQSSDDTGRSVNLRLRDQAAQQNKLRARNRSIDSDVSEKDTSIPPMTINLRLRQALSKVQATNEAPKTHKIVSSSLLKHKSKAKSRLKLKKIKMAARGLKRRRCPPRLSKTVATLKIPAQDAVMMPRVSTRTKTKKKRDGPAQDKGIRANYSEKKQITRNHIPRKSESTSSNQSGLKGEKPTVGRKKRQKVNHWAPSDSTELKWKKTGKVKVTRRHAESKPTKIKAEVESSAEGKGPVPMEFGRSKLSVPAESAEKTAAVRKEENIKAPAALSSVKKAKGEKLKKKLDQKKLDQKKLDQKKFNKKKLDQKKFNKKKLNQKKLNQKRLKPERLNQKGKNLPKPTTESKEEKKQVKAKGAEGILKGLKMLIKSTLVEKEKRKEAPENATLPTSPTSVSADISTACPSKVPEENKQSINKKEKVKKSKVTDKTSRATKRRKEINQDETRKPAKKKLKEGNPPAQPTPADTIPPGCSQALDMKSRREEVSMPCKKTLAAYGKKPYLRLPPTAYLDEKYTAMPKRRKEMLFFESVIPEPGCVTAAPAQTHRCAKCFSTFSSAEELQSHNRLKKCSNLFGFDSDDEGNS